MIKRAVFIFGCCCCMFQAGGQALTNLRQKYISTKTDSVAIDTMSIIPNSFFISVDEKFIDTSAYQLYFDQALLVWNKKSDAFLTMKVDSVKITYRAFPVLFSKEYFHKDSKENLKRFNDLDNPYIYEPDKESGDIFKMQSLSSSGSIARGISFGNNQDVVVNSSLNLQLAGKISKDWEISAALTDNNIPLQPEGNTQQLQDFDKVYIQLSNQNTKIVAGDFELTRPQSYFMNFYKKAQGALVSTKYDLGEKNKINMRTTASASISKGKFARNIFNGTESNQGPYRLTGADNETYIIVLAGSEKVYINGLLMTRGQEFDYVIDYNTAEVTFTPNRIITKDSRIVVEFQYSDKNYVRTLLYINQEADFKKAKLKLNFYSEQDSKNQPLQQDLSDTDKVILANAGDSLQYAVTPNVDSVAFNSNEVLYAMIDTIVNTVLYQHVFIYSSSPDSAHYQLGFSFVGLNKGDYNQIVSPVNGKVFQWIAPVNNIPQGSYQPVIQLIAPQKKQMVTLSSDVQINKNTTLRIEGAMSNNDINTFSSIDKQNDVGYGLNVQLNNTIKLNHDTVKPWLLHSDVNYEYAYKNFTPIETYRSTEFNRDWNINSSQPIADENIAAIRLNITQRNNQSVAYQFKTFIRNGFYHGYMNLLSTNLNYKNYKLLFNGSYLTSNSSDYNSNFLRTKTDFSKTINKVVLGLRQELEHNRQFNPISDSLLISSNRYDQYGAYFASTEKMVSTKFFAEYFRRYDYGIRSNSFIDNEFTDNASANVDLKPGKTSTISIGASYRNLAIKDSALATTPASTTFLGKINYSQTALKGGINFNAYYECGSGQELKKQYAFVETSPGAGVYTWTDYNNNGVKELNEFDVAAFQDQANYIKVYIPTNEYVRTLSNMLSSVLNISPSAFLNQTKKSGKLWSKFSNQTAVRFENKSLDDNIAQSLNPFVTDVFDTNLVLTNASVRNTFFYNRSSNVFGADITYQNNRNKILTTNGYELQLLRYGQLNLRWNVTNKWSFLSLIEDGQSQNRSELYQNKNYLIRYLKTKPTISFQPNSVFRTTVVYLFSNKMNTIGETKEHAYQQNLSLELKLSSTKKGILTARISYIQLKYNASPNTSIAYDMLEGLQPGNNITWNVNLQRNLTKVLQISLNYDGRKSEAIKTIHTAGVQARAFF